MAKEQQPKWELLSTTVAREQQPEWELLRTTAAREHRPKWELLCMIAAREQRPEWELLSMAAAREKHPEWKLLDTAAERPRESGLESGPGETPRDVSWQLLALMSEPDFLKLLRGPGIDSKELILLACAARGAGTTTLFLLDPSPHRLF